MEQVAIIHQLPAIESSPYYAMGKEYSKLNIPKPARDLLSACAKFEGTNVFERPYLHQSTTLEEFIGEGREVVVATGTGSGKTESFLLPLLASFGIEGSERPQSAKTTGCRALILYPMNALVIDQLGRLRRLFGDQRIADLLKGLFGRAVTFGVYTGRTPYPGLHTKERDKQRLGPLFQKLYRQPDPETKLKLEKEFKWPSKDMPSFELNGYKTLASDRELFTRQEMQRHCPDILVTNYSMLEYMLLRPIERSIFESTRTWLSNDPENRFTVILDEAHMYRGAAGAEVAYLLRRLHSRLGASRDRVRYILTSASLTASPRAEKAVTQFAADLSGSTASQKPFVLVRGEIEPVFDDRMATTEEMEALGAFDFGVIHRIHDSVKAAANIIGKLFESLGLKNFSAEPESEDELRNVVYEKLNQFGPACRLYKVISGQPTDFEKVAEMIFPIRGELAKPALECLLALVTFGKRLSDGRVFLPVRMHLFFRGVSGIYACINPNCSEKLAKSTPSLLGRLYSEPRIWCKCGGRVYELLTHRDCGAEFIRGYVRERERSFLWHENSANLDPAGAYLLETHLLVATERETQGTGAKAWLHIFSGRIRTGDPKSADFIPVMWSNNVVTIGSTKMLSFDRRCPICGRGWKPGTTKIMDLKTKGEAPFAYLVRSQVTLQPATRKEDRRFPNSGRKSLLFSDGRQKAARLARDIPREVHRDVFRQCILLAASELVKAGRQPRPNKWLYIGMLHVLAKYNILLFDGRDQDQLLRHVEEYRRDYSDDLAFALNDYDPRPIPRYEEQLLRQLCNSFYSIQALTLGYLLPTRVDQLKAALKRYDESDINDISVAWIQSYLDEFAFNSTFGDAVRRQASGWRYGNIWGITSGDPKECLRLVENIYGGAETINRVLCENLTQEKENGFRFIDPNKVRIELAYDKEWCQCRSCTYLSPVTFRGACTNCGGKDVATLAPGASEYLRARKTFWRDPVVNLLMGEERPVSIDVEEHTAQLSFRDMDDLSSTTEDYERRFRDILLPGEAPIDVLSSTTTMEVGIDIGSLVAVGMRNVPPQRQNYQQRAGRAGRRGSSISTVITYAQNGPHDNYYFANPNMIISGEPPLPVVDIANSRIIQRHIFASLLQAYFHAHTRTMPPTSNIFVVLGTTWNFFHGEGEFTLAGFEEWLNTATEARESMERIDEWIPEGSPLTAKTSSQEFVNSLGKHRPKSPDDLEGQAKDLVEYLFLKGLLPSYAFPRDICSLQIENLVAEKARQWDSIKVEEKPQQGLAVALSEYAPGRFVVVNKQTYKIGAVAADRPSNCINRAEPLFANARRYTFCHDCMFVRAVDDYAELKIHCPICGGSRLETTHVIQPEVVFPEGKRPVDELEDDQVYTTATSAQLPVPGEGYSFNWVPLGLKAKFVNEDNQLLIMVNKGEDSNGLFSGFSVCEKCGAAFVGTTGNLGHHERHYYINWPKDATRSSICDGKFQNVFLGYTFNSDILLIRIKLDSPIVRDLNRPVQRRPLESALMSLAEAISICACHELDIDPREINSGYRFIRMGKDIFADVFIYDTLSGGAGYSKMAGEIIQDVLISAKKMLEGCKCDSSCHECLRHYGNRMNHAELDRLLALDLLHYVADGLPPPVFSNKDQRKSLRPVKEMLEMDGFIVAEGRAASYIVSKNNIKVEIGSYPSLLDPSESKILKPQDKGVLLFNKYQLDKDMPGVFAVIAERL